MDPVLKNFLLVAPDIDGRLQLTDMTVSEVIADAIRKAKRKISHAEAVLMTANVMAHHWALCRSLSVLSSSAFVPDWYLRLRERSDQADVLMSLKRSNTWRKRINRLYLAEMYERDRINGLIGASVGQQPIASDRSKKGKMVRDKSAAEYVRRKHGFEPVVQRLKIALRNRTFADAMAALADNGDVEWLGIDIAIKNSNSAVQSIRKQADDLSHRCHKIFDVARKGPNTKSVVGFVMIEPHKTGIPHGHIFVIGSEDSLAWVREKFKERFPGTKEVLFNDGNTSRRNGSLYTAAEYVSYLFKTLLPREGNHGNWVNSEFEKYAAEATAAWASDSQVRQFRWKGLKPGFLKGWIAYEKANRIRLLLRPLKRDPKFIPLTINDLCREWIFESGSFDWVTGKNRFVRQPLP